MNYINLEENTSVERVTMKAEDSSRALLSKENYILNLRSAPAWLTTYRGRILYET